MPTIIDLLGIKRKTPEFDGISIKPILYGNDMTERGKPFLDKMVDDGKLLSWGWQTHIIGGKVRKLQTMTAKDLPTLLAARAESIELMYPDDSAMGQELAEICGSHVDYIWNNELGK